jgi:hypothetical protein
MTRPPVFDSTEDAAAYLLEHGIIGHYLTPAQYARLVEFAYLWADGGTSLPALFLAFYRGEIERFDQIVSGGNE